MSDAPPNEIYLGRDAENHKWTAQPNFQGIKYISHDIHLAALQRANEVIRDLDSEIHLILLGSSAKEMFAGAKIAQSFIAAYRAGDGGV